MGRKAQRVAEATYLNFELTVNIESLQLTYSAYIKY